MVSFVFLRITQITIPTKAKPGLVASVSDFKHGFATTDGSSVVPNAHVAAMDEADVEKEAVKVRKPAPKKK